VVGCAYITGPCVAETSVDAAGGGTRRVACEPSGTMVLLPAPKLDQLLQVHQQRHEVLP
jgi:hypothetical protein